mmetsp:Transcript_15320/g.37162  ORF Transcript_15320/g.37162 Transcript_15320/m.37162 type:complete len:402 (+) Transcript_15320:321-1526(+)
MSHSGGTGGAELLQMGTRRQARIEHGRVQHPHLRLVHRQHLGRRCLAQGPQARRQGHRLQQRRSLPCRRRAGGWQGLCAGLSVLHLGRGEALCSRHQGPCGSQVVARRPHDRHLGLVCRVCLRGVLARGEEAWALPGVRGGAWHQDGAVGPLRAVCGHRELRPEGKGRQPPDVAADRGAQPPADGRVRGGGHVPGEGPERGRQPADRGGARIAGRCQQCLPARHQRGQPPPGCGAHRPRARQPQDGGGPAGLVARQLHDAHPQRQPPQHAVGVGHQAPHPALPPPPAGPHQARAVGPLPQPHRTVHGQPHRLRVVAAGRVLHPGAAARVQRAPLGVELGRIQPVAPGQGRLLHRLSGPAGRRVASGAYLCRVSRRGGGQETGLARCLVTRRSGEGFGHALG